MPDNDTQASAMISAQEALQVILDSVKPLESVTVSLQYSLGLVLAETIIADEDIPAFDNAAMDGFAVRSGDVKSAQAVLDVVGETAAGGLPQRGLLSGEAMQIMTGAKVPPGADAVIQVEWTEMAGNARVKILRGVQPGHNIRHAGDDIKRDSVVLERGHLMRPQEIGVLASLGRRFVAVHRPAVVAILTTGNEVVPIDGILSEGKVRNSNAFALQALLGESHAEPLNLGIARDDKAELKRKVLEGLHADMILTSGGVSVGKYDLVVEALKEIGMEVKFWKVNIKPGMPMMFGTWRGKPVFGLPGNPVSNAITFMKFVRPAVLKMMGHRRTESSLGIRATIEHDVIKTDGKRHYMRGVVERRDGVLFVRSVGPQASNVLSSLVRANCLIIIPEDRMTVKAGEEIEVELL